MRVLIVDDNASMRTMLTALLGSHGYTVVGALEDGSAVMAAIRKDRPEIVCLDYELPGMNGLDILHAINESTPEIDVLFMTASEDPSVKERAAAEGAAGFINKPFGQSQIIRELDQVRETRRRASAASDASPEHPSTPPAGASPPPRQPSSRPASRTAMSGRTAVIADDNGSIRLLLKGLLSDVGLKIVQMAANGEEAVAAARSHRPSVLCLDVDMPVMSGLDALPLIREASPETAVVMVTGAASREFVTRAASLGAKGYILKPVRPAYIEGFMKRLLE
jgi:DNA-binding NarL/FixJ family response regulator